MISNTNTLDADLVEAIARLGKVSEPHSFWSRIANDSAYSDQHRRRCILALVDRHRPGTVYELSRMLDKPAWLRDGDVQVVDWVVGLIPVDITPDDTVFVINLFPTKSIENSSNRKAAVYVKVAGKVGREEFIRAIRGDIKPGTEGSVILNRVFLDLKTWQEYRRESK